MSNKKTYHKYAASTMAVAAAVASVAPIATSADTAKGFTDVNANHNAYKEIMELSEQGIITGKDGVFMPSQDIKRVQAANMILRALDDVKAPADIEKTLKDLVDVNAESEYAKEIATAVAAGIFKGNQKNEFKPWGPITREQMASTLVRAFNLSDYDKGEKVDINLKGVDASHKDNVQTLANLGITRGTALKDFNPIKPITRAQFSVMVHRTLEVVNGEKDTTVVQSVKAINQTIAADKEQELTFEVNGSIYTAKTFNEKYGEAGYTVSFLTNSEKVTVTDGKVTASDSFKYSVEVKDKDGNAIPANASNAKNFADVTVKSDAIETVTEAVLSNGLNYVTMNADDVSFVATKAIDGLGKEVLPEEGKTSITDVTFERAVSSDTTVAYVEDGKIVPIKTGNVTFDVYFTNVKEPVKVAVQIRAAQEATSMEAIENMKVQTGEVTLPTVKVLDQYGKEMTATPVNKVTDKDNKEVTVNGNKVNLAEAGVYTVKVFASAKEEAKQLGSYQIETVKVDENTKPDVYELDFTKDENDKVQDTLDIEEAKGTVTIDVTGKVDGVKLGTEKFHAGLQAVTDNKAVTAEYKDGVITVSLAAGEEVKVGDVKVTLQNKEAQMVADLVSTTVKVINSAPQIEELTLVDEKATAITGKVNSADALTAADANDQFFTKENIADQLTAGKKDNKEILDAEKMIKDVKFIERVEKDGKLTGKVHVTLDAKYGGKTFVFAAEVTVEPELVSAVIAVSGEGENQQITFTFSDAVELKAADLVKVGEVAGTVASVDGDGKEVVIEIEAANALVAGADATITVKSGEEYVALKNVNFGDVTITDGK